MPRKLIFESVPESSAPTSSRRRVRERTPPRSSIDKASDSAMCTVRGSEKKRRSIRRGRCTNCGATEDKTTLWRTSQLALEAHKTGCQSMLCNACGIFEKDHGRPRPRSLWSIQRQVANPSQRGRSTSSEGRPGRPSKPSEDGLPRRRKRWWREETIAEASEAMSEAEETRDAGTDRGVAGDSAAEREAAEILVSMVAARRRTSCTRRTRTVDTPAISLPEHFPRCLQRAPRRSMIELPPGFYRLPSPCVPHLDRRVDPSHQPSPSRIKTRPTTVSLPSLVLRSRSRSSSAGQQTTLLVTPVSADNADELPRGGSCSPRKRTRERDVRDGEMQGEEAGE